MHIECVGAYLPDYRNAHDWIINLGPIGCAMFLAAPGIMEQDDEADT